MLAHQPRRRADRHGRDQGHDQSFEQEREAAVFPGPGEAGDGFNAAPRALDPRYAGVQPGPMLEEVEVPPGFCLAVVGGTALGAAFGAGEATAGGEVDVDVQSMGGGIEVTAGHGPGCGQPKRQSQQVRVAHCALLPLTHAWTEPDVWADCYQGRFAPRRRGGLRPSLTAASPDVRAMSGRDEETALNRTRKHEWTSRTGRFHPP